MKTIRGRFRGAVPMGAAALVLIFAAGTRAQNPNSSDNSWPYSAAQRSPVLAVVGDIACQPGEAPTGEAGHETCGTPKSPYTSNSLWQSQEATANQIEGIKPDLIAIVGDLQYQVGQYSDFEHSFDLTYGAFKFLQRPSPGNHEFYDEHGQTGVAGYGYFSYYNGFQIDGNGNPITATIIEPCPQTMTGCGNPGLTTPIPQPVPRQDGQAGHFEEANGVADGWYSYNLGAWHLISLNIECESQPGGCTNAPGTWLAAQTTWLKNDLAANHSACTLAYWHQPTFSAADSPSEEGATAQAFWQLLYEYGADVVLNGHDHLYAHYRPLDPFGNYDPKKGIREFIVGTGGETLDAVVSSASGDAGAQFNAANLEASSGTYWGVMALTLDQHGYKWDFESALPGPTATNPNYSDTGVGTCHGPVNGGGN
jgi:hypothetical protein